MGNQLHTCKCEESSNLHTCLQVAPRWSLDACTCSVISAAYCTSRNNDGQICSSWQSQSLNVKQTSFEFSPGSALFEVVPSIIKFWFIKIGHFEQILSLVWCVVHLNCRNYAWSICPATWQPYLYNYDDMCAPFAQVLQVSNSKVHNLPATLACVHILLHIGAANVQSTLVVVDHNSWTWPYRWSWTSWSHIELLCNACKHMWKHKQHYQWATLRLIQQNRKKQQPAFTLKLPP